MVYRFKLLPEAAEDLDNALSWYEKQGGIQLQKRFFNAYLKTRKRIVKFPEFSSPFFEVYRKARLKKFPFKVVYRFERDVVIIIAVAHDRRADEYWKNRD